MRHIITRLTLSVIAALDRFMAWADRKTVEHGGEPYNARVIGDAHVSAVITRADGRIEQIGEVGHTKLTRAGKRQLLAGESK